MAEYFLSDVEIHAKLESRLRPSTWADILERETVRVLRLMFALRPDGHMFHQVRTSSSLHHVRAPQLCIEW